MLILHFFPLHFTLPFIISGMLLIHLMFLHKTGSSNLLGTNWKLDKISCHPYFSFKDILGYMIFLLLFLINVLIFPYNLSDPDNFIKANPLVTPFHIQLEWYFLFAYTILRSIPNKLGGVKALGSSIMIFLIIRFIIKMKMKSMYFYSINKIMFWIFIWLIFMLTWLGPNLWKTLLFLLVKFVLFFIFSFFLNPPITKMSDNIMYK